MKKIVALLLTAVMVLGCMPGLAENTKHERVYVVATADGTIKSITDSVRLENADGLDEIMDQTILSDIQNVGGKETFTLDEKTLTWKANGKDIVYQGTSDKTPVLLPVVTLTLDGADASFADLKNKTGDAVLTVTYQQQAALPILAVTVLPLPQEGITDLKLENAAILSEMGRQALVGWAVPGADEKLNLPASFTASFHADHADLNWMLTFSSADPVDTVCRELNERIDLDIHTEMDEVKLLLKAVQNGEALPETTGKTKDIVPKVNELNDGLAQLNDGAASLADGASQLSSGASELKDGAATLADGAVTLAAGAANAEAGAATLDEGLAALIANNEALNTGAEALFAAVLDTANQQLAAAGLDAAGITEANAEQVRSAVEAAAQQKILEAVLQAAGQEMTAEQYTQAVKAGMVSAEQAAMVSATVEQQMASDEVKAQIEENVLAQIEQLVQQNVESYLASDETVAAKLAMAQTAYDSLSALKAQLDQVNTFVKGLEAYTAGTAQAAAGASQLHTGLTQLSTGAASLSTGASTLSTGASTLADGASQLSTGAGTLKDGMQTMKDTIVGAEKEAANKLLPYVENELADALRIFEETRDSVQNSGYDLRPEGMNAITVYIIRTDLK